MQDLPSHPGAELSRELPCSTGPRQPRRAAHPLLSYEGAFWVCITTFESFPPRLSCFLGFLLSLPAAPRTGHVQEHLQEGLLLARRLPLPHPGTRSGTALFSCLGSLRLRGDRDGAKGAAAVGAVTDPQQVPSRPNALTLQPHPSCGKSPWHPPVELLVGSDANYAH